MKTNVLTSIMVSGLILASTNTLYASVPEIVPTINTDQRIETLLGDAISYTNDGYVEIVKTPSNAVVYAAASDHTIKQVTYYKPGIRMDGAVIANTFDAESMTNTLLNSWYREGHQYYTYKTPAGSIIMVDTIEGTVVSLTQYSKTIADC